MVLMMMMVIISQGSAGWDRDILRSPGRGGGEGVRMPQGCQAGFCFQGVARPEGVVVVIGVNVVPSMGGFLQDFQQRGRGLFEEEVHAVFIFIVITVSLLYNVSSSALFFKRFT